ncbi:hypothetical protein [Hymenobacter sp. BT730]|uniref:hypothetical protein n=1 Tax=Hymenobacter sp. BT730 TaxID=3063332 RepID=UPI0026DEF80C|nr:hypothetical protein [Hymenobacter sp. BT730]
MTRASLLQILDHVTSISEAETRELEQLAATFPYCQTAHLLLAKAAHDHGSMLASQRLRHAATYAADRQLLRELIERQSKPFEALAVSTAPVVAASAAESEPVVAEEVPTAPVPADSLLQSGEELAIVDSASSPATLDEAPVDSSSMEEQPETGTEVAEHGGPFIEEPKEEIPVEAEQAPIEEAIEAVPLVAEVPDQIHTPEVFQESVATASIPHQDEPTSETPETSLVIEPVVAEIRDELPPIAPPIRPPADAGISRFEYGFEEPEPIVAPVLYQLPELEAATKAGVPAFYADKELAYGLPCGSRLGYALVTSGEEAVNLPLSAFFEPDALLLAHAEANRPASPPAPSSFDLINRFLKIQPRLKAPTTLPPVDEQQDLSVRSTSIAPQLASESLAKILVRQGKLAKAIEIYEQLMVRQPEKKTYFADQINQLKPSE